jgi:hypothetical protein
VVLSTGCGGFDEIDYMLQHNSIVTTEAPPRPALCWQARAKLRPKFLRTPICIRILHVMYASGNNETGEYMSNDATIRGTVQAAPTCLLVPHSC